MIISQPSARQSGGLVSFDTMTTTITAGSIVITFQNDHLLLLADTIRSTANGGPRMRGRFGNGTLVITASEILKRAEEVKDGVEE